MLTLEVLDNRTILNAECGLLEGADGREYVTCIARMTWEMQDERAAVALDRAPIRHTPVQAAGGSLRFDSDFHVSKPGTDVLLHGTATPPEGRPVSSFDVRLSVHAAMGLREKSVRVVGPRHWVAEGAGARLSPPDAAVRSPLCYSEAFGGSYESVDGVVACEVNPIGRGFAEAPTDRIGVAAPRFEDPRAPADSAAPAAVGFGPIPIHWQPRASRFGTMDQRWRERRFPHAPADQSPRYACCAPDDQWFEAPLVGDERIVVDGVRATPWVVALPRYRPRFDCSVASEQRALPTHLDTIVLDADRLRVELTWRASFVAPKKYERVDWVRIVPADRLPEPTKEDMLARMRAPQESARGEA